MRPHQLKALIAAAEQGSIRAAARSVFLSQAALTKSLKELEDDMGVALITRTVRGIHLTEAGRVLYGRACAIVAEIRAARDEVERLKTHAHGVLRAAFAPWPALTILPAAYVAFSRVMPDVRVELTEGHLRDALPRLRDGTLDFIVAGALDIDASREFVRESLRIDDIVMVCRRGHPLEQVSTIEDMLPLDWIAYSADADYVALHDATLALNQLPASKRILRCASMTIALSLLTDTDAVALLPRSLLESNGLASRLVRVPVSLEMPRLSVDLLTRRHGVLSAPAQSMIACLREAARI
ncbi:LysR substrate-binding domain-containing protein [Pararobbsia silviterrae]|uniref:LysR family transcriptional regulator n=1 Tax=Pararobbsia silviterrae TaxID=1792498 RepID=A0A494Y952_9BURK|nr:LysR substrate-binding domain-containing protein [Pararobbsia silviterrae]RKP58876.1 LysR family transcriptional regulator [Pararobbsia silviterrae]